MSKTSANPTTFGFEFQTNVAVILFLDNIKHAIHVKMEGKEDVEIYLDDESYILAQAKSVYKPSTDFHNVARNLLDGLKVLSENSKNMDCECLYVTNSRKPLGGKGDKSYFEPEGQYSYYDLIAEHQKTIDRIISENELTLDIRKLKVWVIPFHGDEKKEREKVALREIREFLSMAGIDGVSCSTLLSIWKDQIKFNSTIQAETKVVSKKNLIWPIIVLASANAFECSDSIIYKSCDYDDVDYVMTHYKSVIDEKSEQYDLIIKILSDYYDWKRKQTLPRVIDEFINDRWECYCEDFLGKKCMELSSYEPFLVKCIIRVVLMKRSYVNNLKSAANL